MGKEFAIRNPGGVYTDYELWKEILGEDDLPMEELVKKPNPNYKPIPPEVRKRIREKKASRAFGDFDESKHPRVPAGDPAGGQFTSGGEGGGSGRLVESDFTKPMPEDFRVKEYDEGWSDRHREAYGKDSRKSAEVYKRASEILGMNAEELTRAVGRLVRDFSSDGVISVSESYGNFRISVESRIPEGPVSITRSFSDNGDGTLGVHHDYFTLPEGAQGKGIAAQFLEDSLKLYDKYKVSQISVLANIDVGGYAWGKLGFEASDPEEFRQMVEYRSSDDDVRSKWVAKGLNPEETERSLIRAARAAGTNAPFTIANMPGGKELMLNSDWSGHVYLRGQNGATFKARVHDKVSKKAKHG